MVFELRASEREGEEGQLVVRRVEEGRAKRPPTSSTKSLNQMSSCVTPSGKYCTKGILAIVLPGNSPVSTILFHSK